MAAAIRQHPSSPRLGNFKVVSSCGCYTAASGGRLQLATLNPQPDISERRLRGVWSTNQLEAKPNICSSHLRGRGHHRFFSVEHAWSRRAGRAILPGLPPPDALGIAWIDRYTEASNTNADVDRADRYNVTRSGVLSITTNSPASPNISASSNGATRNGQNTGDVPPQAVGGTSEVETILISREVEQWAP